MLRNLFLLPEPWQLRGPEAVQALRVTNETSRVLAAFGLKNDSEGCFEHMAAGDDETLLEFVPLDCRTCGAQIE